MLLSRIDSDLRDAARAKDKLRLSTLRMLKSAVGYRESSIADLPTRQTPRSPLSRQPAQGLGDSRAAG
jgi:hypothetical protein